MNRLTQEADFGLEDWKQTLYSYSADPEGAYNILDLAEMATTDENTECQRILSDISVRLKQYENTGLTPEEIMDGRMLTGWIPVSERLPVGKEFEIKAGKRTLYRTVIVQTASYNMHAAYYNASEQVWRDDTGIIRLNVVAWMPMPEPYKPD